MRLLSATNTLPEGKGAVRGAHTLLLYDPGF